MELSSSQIQNIEAQLETKGLTYWDIRIEILDHLVSEIEAKTTKGESYDIALENAMCKLNLSGNLEALHKSRLLGINKIVRKQFFNEVLQMFLNVNRLLLILLFVISYAFIYLKATPIVFKYTSVLFLLFPLSIGLYFYIREMILKQKSGYLLYASFYIFFSFLMLNLFIQFSNPQGIFEASKTTQKLVWFLVVNLNTIFSIAGIITYSRTLKKIRNVESKLFN